MKILFLSKYQNTIKRGAESFVLELSQRLSKKHQVDIWTDDSLSKVIKGRYDIVIPINGRVQSLKISIGRLVGGYKTLITGHSGIGIDDIWNIAVARPNVFVALTNYMADWAKQWAWGSKVVTIPNGVDLNKFSPIGQKIDFNLPSPVILSVGALVPYKYHEKVIKAVGELGYGSVLIVGEGPDKDRLQKLGEETLGNRFGIKTFNYEDMPSVYRSCDLFTLPSWDREAFGLVYLEAMASGLGVVAPNDNSRKEIIGEAGILTDTKDLRKYVNALQTALKSKWVQKSIKQANKFSWDKIADSYEKIIEGMILK